MKKKPSPIAFIVILAALSFNSFSAQLPNEKWSIESDNSANIERWHQQRDEATLLVKYAEKLLGDTPAMLSVRANGGGPALLAFSKDINRTASGLDKLGPPFNSPFSYCVGVGIHLSLFWQAALDRKSESELQRIMDSYRESQEACLDQINTAPELTYKVTGPESEAPNLPKGCLYILDVAGTDKSDMGTWTCPASVLK